MLSEPFEVSLPDASLHYAPGWSAPAEADRWLAALLAETPWSQPQVTVFGRRHPVPRLVAWYGDAGANYRYAGLLHRPLPWTPMLATIRARLETALARRFNGVLLNLYRDGRDAMGWHSDDEPELGHAPCIASLSLGETRRFDLRRKGHSRIDHSLLLEHGSLLVMAGATQHHWQHQIARTARSRAPRLNLTFRLIHGGPPHEQ